MIIDGKYTTEQILKELNVKEGHLYRVKVKASKHNPAHISYLCVGFITGGYSFIWNNTYEDPIAICDLYSIDIVRPVDCIYPDDYQMVMDPEEHELSLIDGRPFDEDEELFPPDMFNVLPQLNDLMDSIPKPMRFPIDNNEDVLP